MYMNTRIACGDLPIMIGRRIQIRHEHIKKQRFRAHRALNLVLCFMTSQPHSYGKAAFEKVGVRVMSIWWRRGELNPCPKTHPYIFLRAQFTVFARKSSFPYGCTGKQAHPFGRLLFIGSTRHSCLTFTTFIMPKLKPWSSPAGQLLLIKQQPPFLC